MKKQIRNVAASHRAKLLALARTRGEDFQFLLGRWIIERFLYRLAGSKHKDSFVLKGAMLFLVWGSKLYRPTRDLDLLGFGSANVAEVANRIREICSVPADDGIVFDVADIEAERIQGGRGIRGRQGVGCRKPGRRTCDYADRRWIRRRR